jgi:predicted amidohydrolase YtcJ
MKTQYTEQQLSRFARFCDRHGLQFNCKAEYNAAIKQFFSKD